MSFIQKVANPAFYAESLANAKVSAANYYKPLIRSGSVKPLWHLMVFTSVVMYTTNWVCLKGGKIKHAREEQKVALKEYYEKHGITPHH